MEDLKGKEVVFMNDEQIKEKAPSVFTQTPSKRFQNIIHIFQQPKLSMI